MKRSISWEPKIDDGSPGLYFPDHSTIIWEVVHIALLTKKEPQRNMVELGHFSWRLRATGDDLKARGRGRNNATPRR